MAQSLVNQPYGLYSGGASTKMPFETLILNRRSKQMAIHLDHTIVPAHDKEKSAKFMAYIMGLE